MEMPSHCSHWLQPLDRTVFGPFKKSWKETTTSFLAQTACPVTHANFFRLVTKAWNQLKPEYLVNGFRATGIYPCDGTVIPKEAFLPSSVYADEMENQTPKPCTPEPCTPKPCTPEPCTHTEPFSDVRVSDNTVSLTLQELPQLHYDERTEGTLVDLGISITDSGVVVSSVPLDGSLDRDMADIADNIGASPPDPLLNASSSDTCPPELALAAIECSISQAKKAQYEKALSAGIDVAGDRTFQAWKTYKVKMCPQITQSSDSWLLEVPSVPLHKKPTTTTKGGYFVISCDKAFEEKKIAENNKLIKLEEKKARAAKRLAAKKSTTAK
ncbi:uncharacterized protein LOC117335549 [Pecten maximus]|uniref:uncharacterized protein LOC117315479 n=1 Tax=Pecten maximus TaxID=6579 RepID=UPI0014580D33|nr:uncharacterized protein LOC117315479 [Pecten maximus]XP_033726632.1 uncharacterized protein LOC117316213 [Pecten maximus]XP_033728769.1 uncharacterized protein LOC117317912 [Pecten maximus]XP_033738784.1 uncharacterized protein LOC117326229 [Pecten maximus]XP_033751512.1 uncharacterized protein LOC117335549 [Pecten maximus]